MDSGTSSDINRPKAARRSASAHFDQDINADDADSAPVRSKSFSRSVLRSDSWAKRLLDANSSTTSEIVPSMGDASFKQDLLQNYAASTGQPSSLTAANNEVAPYLGSMDGASGLQQIHTAVDSCIDGASASAAGPPSRSWSFGHQHSSKALSSQDSFSRQNSKNISSIVDQPIAGMTAAVEAAQAATVLANSPAGRDSAAQPGSITNGSSGRPTALSIDFQAPSTAEVSAPHCTSVTRDAAPTTAADSIGSAIAPNTESPPTPLEIVQTMSDMADKKQQDTDTADIPASSSRSSHSNGGADSSNSDSTTIGSSGLHLPAVLVLGLVAAAAVAGAVAWWLKRNQQQSRHNAEPEDEFERELWRMEQEEKALEAEEAAAQKADAAAKKKAAADAAGKKKATPPQAEEAEFSAEQKELAAQQAEARRKEKAIADALAQGDAELAAIDAMGEEALANLDAEELAALEAELAELEGLDE